MRWVCQEMRKENDLSKLICLGHECFQADHDSDFYITLNCFSELFVGIPPIWKLLMNSIRRLVDNWLVILSKCCETTSPSIKVFFCMPTAQWKVQLLQQSIRRRKAFIDPTLQYARYMHDEQWKKKIRRHITYLLLYFD